jgi:hypothetical protein
MTVLCWTGPRVPVMDPRPGSVVYGRGDAKALRSGIVPAAERDFVLAIYFAKAE